MSTTDLSPLEAATERIATDVGPAVVGLRGRTRGGSGVVVAPGRVLTLARNLRREDVSVAFADGRQERGRLLGVDRDIGVALLEVATAESPAPPWAEHAEPLAIGASVFALADPGGRGLRVTSGAVTSSPRSLRGPHGRRLEGLIEHTAPLPRGSGGGPLLDRDGRLLGINAVRVDDGLILALPAAAIQARLEDLAAGREQPRKRLGVAIVPPRAARRLRRAVGLPELDGALVRGVLDDSPAARAGLERGDLIVSVDGAPVDSLDSLFAALASAPVGRAFPIEIVRGVEEREVEVTLEGP
jgi:serine protease Do